MNDTEQKRLYVGLVVAALIIGAFLAVSLGGRSGGIRGEYLLLSELPTNMKIPKATPVLMDGEEVGEVTKASRTSGDGSVAVRMRVGPEAFEKVGEDATAWAKSSHDDSVEIHINPGSNPSSRRLITIKPVKGLSSAPAKTDKGF